MNIVNVGPGKKTNQSAPIGRLNRANFPKSELFLAKSVGKPRFDPLGIEPARQEPCQVTHSISVPSPPILRDSGTVPSSQPGLEIFFTFVLDGPLFEMVQSPPFGGARGGLFFILPYFILFF